MEFPKNKKNQRKTEILTDTPEKRLIDIVQVKCKEKINTKDIRELRILLISQVEIYICSSRRLQSFRETRSDTQLKVAAIVKKQNVTFNKQF